MLVAPHLKWLVQHQNGRQRAIVRAQIYQQAMVALMLRPSQQPVFRELQLPQVRLTPVQEHAVQEKIALIHQHL